MGSDAPHCYVWLGTMQKMANAGKCKFIKKYIYYFVPDTVRSLGSFLS